MPTGPSGSRSRPNTDGLSMYVSPYSAGAKHPWEFPVSAQHKMLETLTVFDDVFVPWERVFCFRQPELAGPIALAFVEYHRFTAVSYKLPLLDALVGAAAEIARMNGVHPRRPHQGQAHAARDLRGDGAHVVRDGGATRPGRRRRLLPPRLRHHQHRQVHLRHRLPRGGAHGAGLRGWAARHRARRRRLGQPRRPAGAREVLRAPRRRRPSASR